jgi:putative aldouronate transport system substrate-binding protein
MEEGLLDRTGFYTTETSRTINDTSAPILYGVLFGTSPMTLLPTEAAADYTALVLHAPGQEPVYRDFMGGVVGGTFALTRACADPAAMLRWVDYLYTEEGCYLARSGELEVDYQRDSTGQWFWLYSADQVISLVQKQDTIDSGTPIPGWVPASYSLSFDNATTRPLVEAFAAVAAISREAVPQVIFTPEEEARLAELWPPLSTYCETRMAWFVAGDWPMDDQHWEEYCRETERLGMAEVTAIWQQALDRQKEAAQ